MGVMGWVEVRAKHKPFHLGKLKVKIWKPIGWGEWASQTLRALGPLRTMWSKWGPGEGFAESHPARRSFYWDLDPGLLHPVMDISKVRCKVPSDCRKKHLPHVPFHIPSPHTFFPGAAVVQRSSANGHDPRGS